MNDQCAEYRSSGPVLPEVVRGKGLVVRDWSDQYKTALSSINKGQSCDFTQAVLKLAGAYWIEKPTRARIPYIFSLVASLLAAEQKNISSRSAAYGTKLTLQRVAHGSRTVPVFAPTGHAALSFLAAHHG